VLKQLRLLLFRLELLGYKKYFIPNSNRTLNTYRGVTAILLSHKFINYCIYFISLHY